MSEISVAITEEEAERDNEKKSKGWDPTRPLYMATKDVATLVGILANTAIYLSVWAIPCGIICIFIGSFCWRKTVK